MNEQHSISDEISESRIYVTLTKFSEKDQKKVKDVIDGKEIVIEHKVRYGKVVCRFIPTPAREAITDELCGRTNPEAAVYRCGLATREAHEKRVINKIKSGTDPKELIDDFFKRQAIEGTSFRVPIDDLAQPYYFGQELMRLLPGFLQQLVDMLDVSYICKHLDEYQTEDFPPQDKAATASEFKKILIEDFLAKHSNEPELRRALRVKRGGPRKRKGFVWTKQRKITFYRSVNRLPKQNGMSVWQFILKMLIDQEFDEQTVSWLKSRPALKGIPKEILNDAIRRWRKYLPEERWNEFKRDDSVRAFEFRHALHLLEYPVEFAYSTLETYYYEGKKLSEKYERKMLSDKQT
jgi:hypothetical protein